MIALKKKPNVTIQDRIEYRYIEVHDTFQVEKPIPKYITQVRTDTFQVNESVFAEIPIEIKKYEDSLGNDSTNIHYKAQISGYKAQLDSLLINVSTRQKEVIKTHILKEKPSKLQCGVIGGVGYGFLNKKPDLFIGIGVSYRF